MATAKRAPRRASVPTPAPAHGRFDALVFVGRFQPVHRGHLQVIARGLAAADTVIVLVGSANTARSDRNPFTYDERRRMIEQAVQDLRDADLSSPLARVLVRPLDDALYNDEAWMKNVQTTVAEALASDVPLPRDRAPRIGIVGHSKDRTSYYLSIFPTYEALDVPAFADVLSEVPGGELSSTAIRARLYADAERIAAGTLPPAEREPFERALPSGVFEIVARIVATEAFARVLTQVAFVETYRRAWASAPYAPTFVTVDAVIVQSGHVLMVRRKHDPGRGLLALPGGFVDGDERLLDACLRETQEETQIEVPRRVLLGALRSREPRTFDDPYRSSRGRTFTHVFSFELDEKRLPRVKGGDDAEEALWVPLAAIDPRNCFEDHAHIIRAMAGIA